MKIFFILRRPRPAVLSAGPDAGDVQRWVRDPLSHPALASMSQRELGDLPFGRVRLRVADGAENCR